MTNDPYPNLLFPTCAQCAGIGLPAAGLLWDMEDECGFDNLRAFLIAHGGRELSLAKRATTQGPADLEQIYAWLGNRMGAGKIAVPKGPSSHKARLAWTIYELSRDGASLAQIAEVANCTTRAVSNHRARLRELGALPPIPHRDQKGDRP